MKLRRHLATYEDGRPTRPRRAWRWWLVAAVVVALSAGLYYWLVPSAPVATRPTPKAVATTPPAAPDKPGKVLGIDSVVHMTAPEATALAHQNYGAVTLAAATGVTKVVFRYRSQLPGGQPIAVYGRAYLPDGAAKHPIWAFAPGTTGIGDACAASLERPQVSNWANYDSHMTEYAGQGYAGVITDYEGMRDPTRLHHYMVGELEGRAVLDSIRAMTQLPQAVGRVDVGAIFLAGYSQGGHAAYWADKIQPQYAPELPALGVVGFGPVMSVKDTLADVTHAANINWFGPYVFTSLADYYGHHYDLTALLQPRWIPTLAADVQRHCIDTVLPYWGRDPAAVYTPGLIAAMSSGDWTAFPQLEADLNANAVGDQPTTSAKLINEGEHDNVVLSRQQRGVVPGMCAASQGPVAYREYPGATHYTTMIVSLRDTLAWMTALRAGQAVPTTCPPAV